MKRSFQLRGLLIGILALASFTALETQAQVVVRTLGGGRTTARGSDAGFVDGNTLQTSQFNTPFGVAVDLAGRLYVADNANGAIRKLDVSANRSTTILTGLSHPVAVALDKTNNVYVLTQGDGRLHRLDIFENLTTLKTLLAAPTALALDNNGIGYVTELAGNLVRVDLSTDSRTVIRTGLNAPGGIAILSSGLVAVSDTANHRILLIDPASGNITKQIGSGTPGFRNGSSANAQFNRPHQLAVTAGGNLVVADRGNHRVRIVGFDGNISTLYGIDPQFWEGPECVTCTPIILPGWFDGSSEFAEARDPIGVTVDSQGTVYTTEAFYHLVREVKGSALTGSGETGGSTNSLVVQPPIITPDSGFYPLGQDIIVTNPNTNAFFSHEVFYTIDGTTPTTNSTRLVLQQNVGTIHWNETLRDLTSLRLIAVSGGKVSEIASGKPSKTNEIGITRDVAAGIGSTVIIPVTVNLRTNEPLRSLQYRIEVAPVGEGAPGLSEPIQPLTISTNDFIPVATSNRDGGASTFSALAYDNGPGRGLAISFIATNSNLSVEQFGVVGMISVPIPGTAEIGDRYSIRLVNPSGTSDGAERQVPLGPMPLRNIFVTNVAYVVGDSSPARWYNAGLTSGEHNFSIRYGFGDGQLNNGDVNNAFAASLGVRVPYPSSDLFDALDAYPEDSPGSVGGDGLIRFLDWQVILRRSLGLDDANWVRTWSEDGVRVAEPAILRPANSQVSRLASSINSGWVRNALLSSETIENVQPGSRVDIPVYVTVAPGGMLGGLAFRAILESEPGAPQISQAIDFVAASGFNPPFKSPGTSKNVLLCGWPIIPAQSFVPSLEGTHLLGHIQFWVPITASAGSKYSLRFSNADGAPDLRNQYEFETRPASVWILSLAKEKSSLISDEWRIHYFGTLHAPTASDDADPDGDGFSNYSEYLAGTHPQNPQSHLKLEVVSPGKNQSQFQLRWQSVQGKRYRIEASPSLSNPSWLTVAESLLGTGSIQEWNVSTAISGPAFYRIRVHSEFSTNQ